MTKRRTHKLIWWLLPLLALRGLVPAGFMIDVSRGELAIVVCPGHIMTGLPAAHRAAYDTHFSPIAEQHAIDQRVSGQAGKTDQPGPRLCPFAVAAGAAPLASNAMPALAGAVADSVDVEYSADSELPFGPARTQQSRAPPHFS